MKEIDKYRKWVEWREEDQVYIGKCPDLITGIHGDDPQQVYRDLCEGLRTLLNILFPRIALFLSHKLDRCETSHKING